MRRAAATLGVTAIAVLFAAMAFNLPDPSVDVDQAAAVELTWRQNEILVMRARTHGCQRELGRQLSPIAERIIAGGPPYRRWVLGLWRKRATFYCKAAADYRRILAQANRDWWFAVRYADRIFPGSSGWLLACSSSEGGHGGWVPNRQGSGAGGWMQFLSGTFYANVDAAFAEARSRGFLVPKSWRSWYSAAGQAVTAAFMLWNGQRDEWFGSRC